MEEITVEIDDVHMFMLKEMDEGVEPEDFVQDVIESTIYQAYQRQKDNQEEE